MFKIFIIIRVPVPDIEHQIGIAIAFAGLYVEPIFTELCIKAFCVETKDKEGIDKVIVFATPNITVIVVKLLEYGPQLKAVEYVLDDGVNVGIFENVFEPDQVLFELNKVFTIDDTELYTHLFELDKYCNIFVLFGVLIDIATPCI